MENKKEMTAPNVSVGADTEQSMSKSADNSITDNDENIKYFEEMQRESLLSFDQSYLKTISMSGYTIPCTRASRRLLTACFIPEHIYLQEHRS